jgi:alpha-galactosidase
MTKISIIGAGSVVFASNLVQDLIRRRDLDERLHIVLHDLCPERLDISLAYATLIKRKLKALASITATTNLREALEESDYIAVMILVGGYEAIRRDFEIPQRYGIFQTVGDTHGIGGISRFIRTIPALCEIVSGVRQYAPNALVLLYSNPLAMNLWAISRLPHIRIVGLCRDVQKTVWYLSQYLDIPFDDIEYDAAGINHMCWLLRLRDQAGDLYPRIREAMGNPDIYRRDVVRFELLRRFGYFVSESSIHLAEYVPYFLRTPEVRQRYSVPSGYYLEKYAEDQKKYESETKRIAFGEELPPYQSTNEIGQNIVHAIESRKSYRFFGNVINAGRISNLNPECVVEVACSVCDGKLSAKNFGNLPWQLQALTSSHVAVQGLAVQGAFEGDMDQIYQACFLDPILGSQLDMDEIVELVDELFLAQGYNLVCLRNSLLAAS